MSWKNAFSVKQKRFFEENFSNCTWKLLISASQKPFFFQNLFFLLSKATLSTTNAANSHPAITYCLQRIQLFFWCSLNSLRCKAGASHRFKSLPAIPENLAVFCAAGYLMNAGCFSKNTLSTGDLNRPRSPEVRKPLVYFWYFSYTRKVRKTFLSQEISRFCKPRNSALQLQLRTATIKTFLRELRGSQTSNQRTAAAASHRNN